MSDPSESKPKIPSWQRSAPSLESNDVSNKERSKVQEHEIRPPDASSDLVATDAQESTTGASKDQGNAILEQARKFLQESSVQSAPRDQKIEFLRSKGVSTENIEKLIGSSKDTTSLPRSLSTTPTGSIIPQSSQARPSQDIPPVITYPEFLMHSEKPPPLITARQLLYTAYFTGGLVAAFYGLCKYLVGPMTESLTGARHDLAVHTQANLQELNERLSKVVSAVPVPNQATPSHYPDTASDISSIEPDPTELYHRDFGTQTSPNMSRRASMGERDDTTKAPGPNALVAGHQKRLEIMHSHLTDLLEDGNREDGSIEDGNGAVKDLSHYLDTLTYPALNYSNYNYDGIYASDSGPKSTKDDAIDAIKKDIRSVKGVLLSARNFPGTARMAGK